MGRNRSIFSDFFLCRSFFKRRAIRPVPVWETRMTRFGLATLVLSALPFGAGAMAADAKMPVGVVELFTSQGCSSCPRADAAFETLADRPDMVALSFHVDYWNYLGWADTMSSPDNTERQYAYAKALGRSNVYTPQAVVNGRTHMNGADLGSIVDTVEDLSETQKGLDVPVSIRRDADGIHISVGPGKGRAHVAVAYFTRMVRVDITKGENAGKTLSYRNVVSSLETIGMWDGKPLDLMLPPDVLGKEGREGAAILVQGEGASGVLGPVRGAGLIPAPGV